MPAKFYEQGVSARLTQKRALSGFLDVLIAQRRPEIKRIRLTCIFCNDAHLHGINMQFLNHDDYTDIITFDLTEKAEQLIGEIYISIERIAENANTFSTTYDHELHRVIFHGALHLCGLRDKTPAEQKAMRAAENAALQEWFAKHL